MSTPEVDFLWDLAAGQALLHREWDGEYLLFNDLSGDTHLLDRSAMQLLLALQGSGPLPEPALGTALGDDQRLAGMLADLESLSLIRAIEC